MDLITSLERYPARNGTCHSFCIGLSHALRSIPMPDIISEKIANRQTFRRELL